MCPTRSCESPGMLIKPRSFYVLLVMRHTNTKDQITTAPPHLGLQIDGRYDLVRVTGRRHSWKKTIVCSRDVCSLMRTDYVLVVQEFGAYWRMVAKRRRCCWRSQSRKRVSDISNDKLKTSLTLICSVRQDLVVNYVRRTRRLLKQKYYLATIRLQGHNVKRWFLFYFSITVRVVSPHGTNFQNRVCILLTTTRRMILFPKPGLISNYQIFLRDGDHYF